MQLPQFLQLFKPTLFKSMYLMKGVKRNFILNLFHDCVCVIK